MMSFNMTEEERTAMDKVIDRALNLPNLWEVGRMDLEMGVNATHSNGCPLDFEKLLNFDDFNFTHDVIGILNHINKETGKLINHFSPHCSK